LTRFGVTLSVYQLDDVLQTAEAIELVPSSRFANVFKRSQQRQALRLPQTIKTS
jgi:hypothetical protein